MLLSLFQNAGIVRYPLLICSVLAVAIILERAYVLFMMQSLEDRAFDVLSTVPPNDRQVALADPQVEAAPSSRVIRYLLPIRHESEDSVARATDVALSLQRMRLRRSLGTLATIGSTTPFVGLFGTVLGVMSAFQGMSRSGLSGDAMASGIAEALSATAFGLLVAVPSIVAYNYFVGRIQAILLNAQAHLALLAPLYLRTNVSEIVHEEAV